jgi:hypothetical protein
MHIYTVLDYLLPENIYLSREKNSENTTDKFPVLNTRQITVLTCTFLIPKISLTFNTVKFYRQIQYVLLINTVIQEIFPGSTVQIHIRIQFYRKIFDLHLPNPSTNMLFLKITAITTNKSTNSTYSISKGELNGFLSFYMR